MSYYLHDLTPYLFRYSDGVRDVLVVRWYGLAYLAGFVIALLLLKRLVARGYCALAPGDVLDFTTYGALLGVMLGGRLGYMVLYNWESFSRDLSLLFQIGRGGASSHGGILGLALFTWLYARKKGVSWLNLGDNVATAVPLGIFLGRIANFMDGELFGRVSTVRWAVLFPSEIHLPSFQPAQATRLAVERLPASSFDIMQVAHAVPQVMEELQRILNPRHPSQLYEAFLEGLLLFGILYFVRTRARRTPDGLLSGLFLVLYAVLRIGVEFFREPDVGDPLHLGLSRGQLFSLPMIAVGMVLLGWSLGRHRGVAGVAQTPGPSLSTNE
ncbi:prolipoprotein diacylglyceryl transferase [Vitiosangium sp. GDMCC 1.1324]|uniref:prolipoprotein diacylglyceryl transferase n=1 Tax=Vitiosangium sp. (strain GDMCC 1.1324) TaxID=2138576 RepID=UPI00130D6E92|nr:prolipoprotein diacylglyceryl transferase [Vitiosangium sp. GDMCC 1.1324]